MTIEKIYVDMDGVLADFDRGIVELCNIPAEAQGENGRFGDEKWAAIREVDRFYDKLEPVAGAIEMFMALYERYGTKCEILSAVPKPHKNIPTAGEDKISWVKRYLPADVVVNLVYRAEKQQFVKGKGCVLIDDYQINITEWEASGGTGIWFETADGIVDKVIALESLE